MADPVAAEGGRLVGRIVDRSQAEVRAQRPGLASGAGRGADGGRGPHAGQPVEPGAPQEVEQHGLGLVVGRVAGQDVGRQDGVARGPGPGLEVRPRRRPRPARRGTPAPKRPAASATTWASSADAGAQPVVDVDRRRPGVPAATARTSRASESAPPDTAQATLGAAGREPAAGQERSTVGAGARPWSRPTRPGQATAPARPTRSTPALGLADLLQRRAAARDPPSRRRRRAGRRPPRCGR